MKTYVKPTVDVVELSVKENMAALPDAVKGEVSFTYGGATYDNYTATVYDLTAQATSNTAL
ncbi:MAG: hypothetical protein IKV73_01965 [Clostridia bacterium]|nr:hypothetical protein [Clostridia bacterium]